MAGKLQPFNLDQPRGSRRAAPSAGRLPDFNLDRGRLPSFNLDAKPAPVAAKPHHGGGFLHGLGHAVSQGASDLKDVALAAPGGVYQVGKALTLDEGDLLRGRNANHLAKIEKAGVKQVGSDLHHPLRHPGLTLLDVLPFAGVAGKAAEAARAARAGETLGTVAKTAIRGAAHEPRVLKVGDLEVRGHYSRAAGSRVVQRAVDRGLEKGAKKGIGVSVGKHELSAESVLHSRAAKWMGRNERVAASVARTPGTRLAKLGAKLKPEELRALRLVAEEAPVERRLAAQNVRLGAAKTAKEAARHQERLDLTQKATQFLDTAPDGKPVFKPGATKLAKVYDALKAASTDREHLLENVGLLDKETAAAAKTKTARVAAGAQVVKGEVVGADDVSASSQAVHIGNPVERTKVGGQPRVSSRGTFGKTRKPGSLKGATGGAVEHALERNDVTNIVAERHAEAVRLSAIDRARTQLAKAGTSVPRKRDDIFVRTGDLVRQEKLPAEVRQFLDNPERLAELPERERGSILDQIRQTAFAERDWHVDAEARQGFEKLAQQGKGMFVPRKLAGDIAKREVTLPGSAFVDAVNNAQKAGLIYLKVNYPVVQGLSNVAMNLIHEGFAAPVRLTQAVKLDRSIGPDLAGVVDDIMGEGAVVQAQFSGVGAVSRASQKLAQVMSSKVDTPARRAAFLHEAHKAGYGSPAKLEQLLTDDSKAGDLAEVAQRAKEAIVDYGELGPVERGVIRRLVFVYPWQKGATKYAGHFLRDHPVQAAALGQLGEQAQQESDQQLGPVPSYLQGVFQAGGGLVNPAGVNFFQTPASIGEALAGIASGNPAQAASGQGFLSPAPGIAVSLLSGRNDTGAALKGNLLAKLRDLTYGQTPAAQLGRAALGGRQDVAGEVVRKGLGSRRSSKTFPNTSDPYWRFLLGGLYPRQFDRGALNQNAAREKTGR